MKTLQLHTVQLVAMSALVHLSTVGRCICRRTVTKQLRISSCFKPLRQSEAWCTAIHIKMNLPHFYMYLISYQGMGAKTRFEKQAKGDSEIAYLVHRLKQPPLTCPANFFNGLLSLCFYMRSGNFNGLIKGSRHGKMKTISQ